MSTFGPSTSRQHSNIRGAMIPNRIGSGSHGRGMTVDELMSEIEDDHLIFEARMESPYIHSLAGEYDMGDDREELLGTHVSGLCPICNNKKRRTIERMYLKGKSVNDIMRESGASPSEVRTHFRYHFAGIHSAVAVAISDIKVGDAQDMKLRKFLRSAQTDAMDLLDGKTQTPDAPGIVEVPRMEYAMNGPIQEKPLRPWMKSRSRRELEKKLSEAINLYSEMLDCRDKARRVYNEIMDSGEIKYYGTAIAAIKEQRGVVETLGKMSLIAKTLSDGGPMKGRNMSPELKDLMVKLGIKVDMSEEPPPLEALGPGSEVFSIHGDENDDPVV